MDRFLNDISIPRDTVRLTLTGEDFIAQLTKITDLDDQPLLNAPGWKGITRTGEGFGVEYPTARIAFLNPKPEILPDGFQKNLFTTLAVELLFRFNVTEDGVEINIQGEAHSLASYVWNWLIPKYDDNPNGMVPTYPEIWRWDDFKKGEQALTRSLLIPIDNKTTGMSGTLYATRLYLPLRIFNPLVPWPIPT